MDMAAFESGGLKVLPLEPETRRILNDSKGRASDYYSLIASCMLESEFLPAADERAGWVMRFIEEKGGLRLGMCEFGGGIDHAYTYGYWLDCLKLDRVKQVDPRLLRLPRLRHVPRDLFRRRGDAAVHGRQRSDAPPSLFLHPAAAAA